MDYLSPVIKTEQFGTLCAALRGNGKAALFGVHHIHRSLYAAALANELERPVLFICDSDADAVSASADITEFGAPAVAYTSRDLVFMEVEGISHDLELDRLCALAKIVAGGIKVACVSLEAYCQFTMPPEVFRSLCVTLKVGESVKTDELLRSLVSAGYTRGDRVDGKGQFAVRGGITDIFPPHAEHPYRIEFFGDEIDSICVFDELGQRRIRREKTAFITPVREVCPVEPQSALKKLRAMQKSMAEDSPLYSIIQKDAELLENGITPACTDRYLRAFYESGCTVRDYLPDAVLFMCEPASLEKRFRDLCALHTEELLSLKQSGMLPKKQPPFLRDDFSIAPPARAVVLADVFTRSLDAKLDALINVRANVIPRWGGEFALLREDVKGYTEMGYAVTVLAGTTKAASALCYDLETSGFKCAISSQLSAAGSVGVCVGALSGGYELNESKVCVIASRREKLASPRKAKKQEKAGRAISGLEDLHIGDYVVHENHGIGVFEGIQRIDHHGFIRDYIKIRYRGTDTLFVPVTQLDMVSQYISPKDDGEVKLAKLRSNEWAKTKQNVYRAVREMAHELIELYAKREHEEGYAFSPDGEWQRDFEDRFPYDETDDQIRTISEIKGDMLRARPMDRLLCGDVGVGKTEVALRAAFKCVGDGKQCAMLVPTTILAWQHYNTFCERMEPFPVKIAMLSRFSTAKEIRAAVEEIKNGTVDIAIGTHRLLQKDVNFKRLGLLIIDEEQRFGVSHKEKLKTAFPGVDVLTLSATPIPRTLNMAMSGIRDMSVIEHPPEDRHPVATYVVEFDHGMMLDAIKRELARGGQVYYLHNRVDTIDVCASHLQELLPDARIDVAHGKMGEDELSDVWKRLINHDSDILVCTTIIETGVDVPNVNTLIVENADYMGLSQLYQIRGRVGRSGRRAFAYFTFSRDKTLSEIASKRLSAIRDFTSFGSGFKIALRDLQIRGAGSVLSARQSGHMAAVGYDAYLKILSQAISDETGAAPPAPKTECTVDLSVSAYIPESYIPDNESRIELYKRIAAVSDREDADDVVDELLDRFGNPPECVLALVTVSLARALGGKLGIYEIAMRGTDALLFYTDSPNRLDVSSYIKQKRRRVLVSPAGKSHVAAELKAGEKPAEVAAEVLENLILVD